MIMKPGPGKDVEKVVRRTINASPALIAKTKKMLGYK
jgi:hypothetical protein